jgi:hypothetical protein
MKKHKDLENKNFGEFIEWGVTGDFYFEIGSEITDDIGEAVSILMRHKNKKSDSIWETKISNIDTYEIKPEKSLYWLTGGHDEWKRNDHYLGSWSENSQLFTEKFGDRVISIIRESKTFGDIRKEFIKQLNLPKLYNFALEIGIA